MGMSHEGLMKGKDGDGWGQVEDEWSHLFGDDSEPVCVNGSVVSGSLIKLLSFFGKQIQQGSLESPGWSPSWRKVVVGLDGGRRIQLKIGVAKKIKN
jgi:hypothetical protein